MREERLAGELPEARASSFKMALLVVGGVLGLGLLLCGGVAGYVAWTDRGKVAEIPVSNAQTPENIRAVARRIAAIEMPEDFEPIHTDDVTEIKRVAFGRKTDDGALLKLARIDLTAQAPGVDQGMRLPMLIQMADMGEDRINTTLSGGILSPERQRELTILGKPFKFRFMHGRRTADQPPVRKVIGAFRTQRGLIAVVCTMPEDDYDEESVVKMIESVRLPPGDAPLEEDASEESATTGAAREAGDAPGTGKSADRVEPAEGEQDPP